MIYLKVAIAAIQRYKFEQQYRILIQNHLPKRNRSAPFSVCMMMLRQRRIITNKQERNITKQYNKLSKVLHGI